jgi:hypothetical protein
MGNPLPLWFRAVAVVLFSGLFIAYFAVRNGVGLEASTGPWPQALAPVVNAQAVGSRSVSAAPNGEYRLNGMRVRYRTYVTDGTAQETLSRFERSFARAGYHHRLFTVGDERVLVAVHPKTEWMLTVRFDRDAEGRPAVRLSEQDLSQLRPPRAASLGGVPIPPEGRDRVLITPVSASFPVILTYRLAGSRAWVESLQSRRMTEAGWQSLESPVEVARGGMSTLFFRRRGAEATIVVMPGIGANEALVMITVGGEERGSG